MSAGAYLTLAKEALAEHTVQKSRFLCYAAPCADEEAAKEFVACVKASHPQARHHCYAYVIGANEGIMRYQDDGEPGGTAGLPILNLLRAQQLVDCCAIVVRYFGGILLGTGGLARAYGKACSLGVEAAGIVAMEPTVQLWLHMGYPQWERVRARLADLPVLEVESVYEAAVRHQLMVRLKDAPRVKETLINACDGQMEIEEAQRLHYPWPTPSPSA